MLSSTPVPLTSPSLPFSFMQCLWSADTFVQFEGRHNSPVTVELLFCCLTPFTHTLKGSTSPQAVRSKVSTARRSSAKTTRLDASRPLVIPMSSLRAWMKAQPTNPVE
ncbi:hypothetical protein GQ607_003887 [Colletotrichum asianum]|uniref:Uncharacterized protein n=1 Tax=Colletotrichum asianum TaxID=702518 RepID=A0A8H3WQP9_9PEZI|nr:hypothetical protein GQ607_003887 [Colletotrichum asianum]